MTMVEDWIPTPNKTIRTGIDRLHRPYVVVDRHSDAELHLMHEWLADKCLDRWCSLGRTVWFTKEADRTAFLLRWV